MSTKTTFKRIALVAVAALGFGLVSVAPSQAAPQADSFTSATTSSTGVVNVAQTLNTTVSFIADTNTAAMSITPTVLTAPATAGAFAVTGAVTASTANVNTAYATGLTVTAAGVTGRVTAAVTLSFTPDKVGTYTIKLASGTGTNNQSITWTVVATDVAGVSATYSRVAMTATGSCSQSDGSWAFGNSACVGTNNPGIYSNATDTVTATATLSNVNSKVNGALIASFKLTQSNGATNTMVTTVPWTVSITSGPGNIQMGYLGRLVTAKSVTEGTTTSGSDGYAAMFGGYQGAQADLPVYFISDGTTGTTVITFTAGGVLVATRTITVYGAVTSLTATQAKSVYGVGANASGISVVAKDANGAVVPSASIAAASATTTVATINTPVSTSNVGAAAAFDVTGVAAGTSVVTFTSGTITTTSTVTVGSGTVAAIALTTDATSYLPGSKVVLTATLTSADGKPVADGSYAVGATSSIALAAGSLPVATPSTAFVGGKASWTLNAPITEGEFVITGTSGTLTGKATAVTENAAATAAAQAASDAAAEATDAANAATDAANAAAEAADAATAAAQDAADAVAALSVQVSEQIAELKAQNEALRKQLIALTNLIIKIQKKVKA
jgi:hypothetical protein